MDLKMGRDEKTNNLKLVVLKSLSSFSLLYPLIDIDIIIIIIIIVTVAILNVVALQFVASLCDQRCPITSLTNCLMSNMPTLYSDIKLTCHILLRAPLRYLLLDRSEAADSAATVHSGAKSSIKRMGIRLIDPITISLLLLLLGNKLILKQNNQLTSNNNKHTIKHAHEYYS